MNNDTIIATAHIALKELITDPEGGPINDDDFADIAEIILINNGTTFDPDTDLQLISDAMIDICDTFNIAH